MPQERIRTAFIGLGANLDNPRIQVTSAIRELSELPDTRLAAQSSLYRSAPLGGPPQPDYINACAKLETALAARPLLDALLGIENAHGRERSIANAPRTLDLDLLWYDEQVINEPGLAVPHPRMHTRAFVLLPLSEIEPELVIPGHGAIKNIIATLTFAGMTKQHAD